MGLRDTETAGRPAIAGNQSSASTAIQSTQRPRSVPPAARVECAIVGDAGVGKTSVLASYIYGDFGEAPPPVWEESESVVMDLASCSVVLTISDTLASAAQRSPPLADVYIVLFSIANAASMENAVTGWMSSIRSVNPAAAIILAATMSDLRGDRTISGGTAIAGRKRVQISAADCQKAIRRFGGPFFEISAK